MYKKVENNLNFVEREREVGKLWKNENIFQKSIDNRNGKPIFTFYDGPPTANGTPHIGHVLTRVIKDLVPRYQTMKGKKVLRKAGWDTHGLPVELEVEKLLGLEGKEQIEEYGVEAFVEKCKENVWKYKEMWEDFSQLVGFWADMDNPYVTYHNEFIESEWWALKEIAKKGLLYKGHKVVPYCPRCGTSLSTHEVSQGYKDVKDTSAYVRFKVKGEDAYFLAWTTTPWTLPSNVALAVNPHQTYMKVEVDGNMYYLAEALLDEVLGVPYKVHDRFEGKELEYKEYIPLYEQENLTKKAYFVTCADYVTLDAGTGIVHIAPAFGDDDSKVGRIYDLPFVQLVNEKGEMTGNYPWENMFCKDADKLILEDLNKRNLLFGTVELEHSYPHCWRCDTPLIYYANETWFIEMTKVRDDLIKNNKTVNWLPESIGEKRFADWLANVQDWGLSRNRYWGTPLNVWECSCGHQHVIGSIQELKELSDNCPKDIELHRPFIDEVTIPCEKCNSIMHRVEEVIDCWFDSGAMPFAQWHYPFENKELFDENFPADFISEAIDQTRGWFYSLLAISTILFDKSAYKNVLVLGHIQDENGQKMSKSKGNSVDPFEILEEYGADAVRWYFYVNSAPWLPNRFNKNTVVEIQRKFLGTLWNTYSFFVLYADIDKFNPTEYKLDYDKLSIMDKWVLSRLNSVVKDVDAYLNEYKIMEAARLMETFVDELSNWYVRRGRERYWGKDMSEDKVNAYMTLYTVLVTFAKLAAPMIPYMSEEIYQNLVASFDKDTHESIHLCGYPIANTKWIDTSLEERMKLVQEVVVLGRSLRNTSNLKNRQPLQILYIKTANQLTNDELNIIKDELNVKEVVFTNNTSKFMTYQFKPLLKTLGPKYGKDIGKVKELLQSVDGNQFMEGLDSNGKVTIQSEDTSYEFTKDDLIIESVAKSDFVVTDSNGITIALYTYLSDELVEEGTVREVISKIQNLRKENGFEVMDTIQIAVNANNNLISTILNNKETIMSAVLATSLEVKEETSFISLNINGVELLVNLYRNK
ncbi:isoleucine--tRNA ligase [Breznakia pachnodae]|uniref:Isoleucine--tRNA ligase n=1 Tax=Breznakia pachnodae TaxID=265178 RepID=A0ABU0E6A3_9FIRM|nr:isoleucine--tRNA ligase [Breznakia pachnodae]MDQ0362030.1 isoleucyl-tRNA synthetase [Breznakia pachnodae]